MADHGNTLRLNLLATLEAETFQLSEVASSLEDIARAAYARGSVKNDPWIGVPTDLLQAAATYRLVVAQEQTAYLLQRLVDEAEKRQ
jgi:hypothetical protein